MKDGHLSWICRGGRYRVKGSHVRIFPLDSLLGGRTVVHTFDHLGSHQGSYRQVIRHKGK